MKVLIPTCRERDELEPLLVEVSRNTPGAVVFASCLKAAASVNRNVCLDRLEIGEIAVMIDDDIRGFYPGWLDDLVKGLAVPNAAVVSARLLNQDGNFGPTCSQCYAPEPEEIVLLWRRPHCIIPTAAIAFVNRGHRFDENFSGSGWEDNDWMKQIAAADPSAMFVQSNRCQLVHLNHMTNQKGSFWQHNKDYFFSKWMKELTHA